MPEIDSIAQADGEMMDGRAPAQAGTFFSSSLVHFDAKFLRLKTQDKAAGTYFL